MKKIIVILIVLILLITTIILIKKRLDNSIVDKEGMVNVNKDLNKLINTKVDHKDYTKIYYSSSGNMRGNTDTLELDINKKIIIKRYAEGYNDKIEETIYKVSEKDINNIIKIVDKYNFVAWSKLPQSDEIVLDGPDTYWDIICEGQSFKINYLMKFPEGASKLIYDFTSQLKELCREENIIDKK